MKAAIFYGPGQPFTVEEVPTPKPKPGEVLVKVAACGVCHTDLHYTDHNVPTFKKPPLILGHEASGVVAAVGHDVTGWAEGDRVLLPAVYGCGVCDACRRGRENICDSMIMFGNNIDGAFAEYIAVSQHTLFALPQELPLVESCIIADAITTPYQAVVNRGQVKPGDVVAVFGCGGIGLNVVQMAAAAGGQVIAVDVLAQKLAWAKQMGAEVTIDAGQIERVDKEIRKLSRGGADVTLRIRGRERSGRAESISDDAPRIAEGLRKFLMQVPGYARFYDMTLDQDGVPKPEDLARAAEEVVMIEIRLGEPAS